MLPNARVFVCLFSFGHNKGTGLISDVTEGLTWEYEPK